MYEKRYQILSIAARARSRSNRSRAHVHMCVQVFVFSWDGAHTVQNFTEHSTKKKTSRTIFDNGVKLKTFPIRIVFNTKHTRILVTMTNINKKNKQIAKRSIGPRSRNVNDNDSIAYLKSKVFVALVRWPG
jgi:hypothetical protein